MNNWHFIGEHNKNCISTEQLESMSRSMGATVICLLPVGTSIENTTPDALDILLNEQYAWYGYWVGEEVYCMAGGRNSRLQAGSAYELLVRLAETEKVVCVECEELNVSDVQSSCIYTDAYLLSRYADVLQKSGYFETFLESCVQSVAGTTDAEFALAYIEAMVRKDTVYWETYRQTQPFLIVHGDAFCYNILNEMAFVLGDGLEKCGQKVEYCDLSTDKRQKLSGLSGKCYKAVIGFQSFISNIYLQGKECYLTDFIHAPKIEMVFDHPFWFYEPLESHGTNFYTCTHDENYVRFIEKYGQNVAGSYLLPPADVVTEEIPTAGIGSKDVELADERSLDVVFIGTYNDYREKIRGFYTSNKNIRHMAARYIKYLKEDINAPAEVAFAKMLSDYAIEAEGIEFARMMYQFGDACQCVMYYYREKIIRTLLEAGIVLHVYGDSWLRSPFAESPYMIWHDQIPAEESRMVLEQTKISLNVLAWHKGGCNERIIHSMLAGAVVVTDKSSYIEKNFKQGEELIYYDLEELESLPMQIKQLLQDDEARKAVAMAGRRKAMKEYSSVKQAERLLEIVEKIELE